MRSNWISIIIFIFNFSFLFDSKTCFTARCYWVTVFFFFPLLLMMWCYCYLFERCWQEKHRNYSVWESTGMEKINRSLNFRFTWQTEKKIELVLFFASGRKRVETRRRATIKTPSSSANERIQIWWEIVYTMLFTVSWPQHFNIQQWTEQQKRSKRISMITVNCFFWFFICMFFRIKMLWEYLRFLTRHVDDVAFSWHSDTSKLQLENK